MAGSNDHDALLDRLQSHINLVLEQTGRIFAAIATNPKEHPTAQVTKLKTSLPIATNHFHHALDQLENQLQLATLVMRRDLAVSRDRAGIQAKPDATSSPSPPEPKANALSITPMVKNQSMSPAKGDAEPFDSAHVAPSSPPPDASDDINMTDWLETTIDPKTATEPTPANNAAQSTAPASTPPLTDTKPSVAAHTLPTTSDAKASSTALQLDTKQSPPPAPTDKAAASGDDEKAPDDTANDLDSLFNDPTSADDPTTDFPFEHSGATDMMDFTTFDANADNDNISSLLPGLEDYANTQSTAAGDGAGGGLDFNSLFNVAGDAANNDAMNSQGAGEQRDTTFDDLLDLANFDGIDPDAGDNDNTTGDAFDFDSLFN